MKKIICSLIAILMVLAVIPLSSLALYGYTDIRTEDQLRDIARDLTGKYRLIRNIDLSDRWEPIGTSERPFTGILDGNGYTISGLNIETSRKDNQGFFGVLDGQALDLKIEGNVTGRNNVGGIAGTVIGGRITGCTFSGTVSGSTNVGGIVGYADATNTSILVNSCRNIAMVYGDNCLGGIIGSITAATGRKVDMQLCANIGNISASSGIAGGIVGFADVNDSTLYVGYSYNSGSVSASSNAGGIVGEVSVGKSATKVEVSYCYNSENVSGRSNAGAVIGKIYTSGDGTASNTALTVNEFYNIGTIDGTHDGLLFTSVRDLANKTTVSKAYNSDYSREHRDSYEYEGYITSRNSLSASYGNLNTLGFNTSVWTYSGNKNYPFIQLRNNRAVVKITEQPVIEGNFKVGETISVKSPYDTYSLEYIWYRNGVIIKDATRRTYQLTSADAGCMISVRISAGRNADLIGSVLSKSVQIAESAAKPLPPVAAYITNDSVTLKTTEGCEYRIGNGSWQNEPDFTGLEAGRTYAFYQRVKATSDVSESPASDPTEITIGKTNIAARNSGHYFEIVVDNSRYSDYCYCDSKLSFRTDLALHEYEIAWYADGEIIANSEGSSSIKMSDEFVDKKVVAVVKGINELTGIYITEYIIPEHYSSYVYDVVEPTCSEWGYTVNYCRRCGSTFFNRYVKPTGHTFGDWVDVKPATCTEDGIVRRTCTQCGESETRDAYARGHNFIFEMQKANCGEDGYTRERCVRCGYCVYYDKFPASSNHNYVTSTKQPTCTEEGGVLHTCSNCGHSYITNAVPATGHIWGSWTVVKPATATTKGLEKRVCTVCKEEETREIPVSGETPDVPPVVGGDDISVQKLDGKDYLFGLAENTPIDFFGGNDVKIYGKDGKVKTSGVIGTGDRIVFANDDGSAFIDAIAVIKGDTDGDGKVTATDYIKVRLAVLKKVDLKGAQLYAGIINGGNKITVKDYTSIRLHIIGKVSLYK